MDISVHDDFLGDTTAVPVFASYDKGTFQVTLNIRYPSVVEEEWVVRNAFRTFNNAHFEVEIESSSKAHFVNPQDERVELLTAIVNEELRVSLRPYAMGGATHARYIPGALGFGPGRFGLGPSAHGLTPGQLGEVSSS